MTNPMEAIATAAISIKSIRPLNHTPALLSNHEHASDQAVKEAMQQGRFVGDINLQVV
jgi:hypothetical protein